MKVVVYPADRHGCGFHRLVWPAEALRARGYDVTVVPPEARRLALAVDDRTGEVARVDGVADADVVVLQRVTHRHLAAAVPALRAQGVAVVIDVDDDLAAVHPGNPAFAALHPRGAGNVQRSVAALHSWHHLRDACRAASLVTVSTDALVPRYGAHGRVRVVRNHLAPHYYDVARNGAGTHQTGLTLGWPAAPHSHPDDPAAVGSAVQRLLTDHAELRLWVPGEREEVARLFGLGTHQGQRVTGPTGVVALTDWPAALAELDVGICPLADTRFNAGKCLDADTRVATRRGVLRLREVVEGDEVRHDDRWHKVIALRAEAPTTGLEIETRRGKRLKLTAEHRLRVDGTWRRADELRVGDALDGGRETWGDQEEYVTLPWPADSRRTRHVATFDRRAFWTATHGPRVTLNETWGRLLGLIVGDGCVAGTGSVSIAFDRRDQDLIDVVLGDLRSVGLNASYEERERGGRQRSNGAAVIVTSAALVRFLELVGVARARGNVTGTYERVLDVPEFIWRSPRPVALAFLGGLLEADGSGTNGVTLCTKSETLARSVQRLLTALGVTSTIRRRDGQLSYVKKDGARDYVAWNVTVLTRELDAIRGDVMISSRKRTRLAGSIQRREAAGSHGHGKIESLDDEITAITSCRLEPIDVQVDGEVLLVDGLVSHNSWLKPLELSAAGVPWVASPRAEYTRLHALGAGRLAARPKDWYREVRRLVQSEDARTELIQGGLDVAAGLRLVDWCWLWWEAWEDAWRVERGVGRARVVV